MKLFRKVFASENLLLFEEKHPRFCGETLSTKRSQIALREFSGIPEGRFPFSEDSKGTLFREKGFLLSLSFHELFFETKEKRGGELFSRKRFIDFL